MTSMKSTVTAILIALAATATMVETANARGIAGFAAVGPGGGGGNTGGGNTGGGRDPGAGRDPGRDQPQKIVKRYDSCKGSNSCSNKPEVCFYTLPNFKGKSFCSKSGAEMGRLGATWNDRISSIMVHKVKTKVCSDRGLNGKCILINSSRSRLRSLDDAISSIAVH